MVVFIILLYSKNRSFNQPRSSMYNQANIRQIHPILKGKYVNDEILYVNNRIVFTRETAGILCLYSGFVQCKEWDM